MLQFHKKTRRTGSENIDIDESLKLIPTTVFKTLFISTFVLVLCPLFCLHPQLEGLLPSKHACVLLLASSIGSMTLLFISPLVLLAGAVEFKCNRLNRRHAIYVTIFTTYLIFYIPLSSLNHKVRVKSYVQSMLHLQPLINSIEKYTKLSGCPPEHLYQIDEKLRYGDIHTKMNAFPTASYNNHQYQANGENTWSLEICIFYDYPSLVALYEPSKTNHRKTIEGINIPPNWTIKTMQ